MADRIKFEDGEIDELVFTGFVHLEMLNSRTMFAAFGDYRCKIYVGSGRLHFEPEQEGQEFPGEVDNG